ncbi:MAG: tannase/feruloyl esterase family alpha/beta hydrolase [Acidobacteria bacterium]|nr:tannase/feruloyl esterase family alpha/beta hydrolase [Acidobacteriota bacterium]
MKSALFVATAVTLYASTPCADLAKLSLPHTRIETAALVKAGEFKPPEGNPVRLRRDFCRVSGTIKPAAGSNIWLEVWMPASDWNGKFQGVGNGGYAGSVGYAQLAAVVNGGYATAGTDTGHRAGGQDARWALNQQDKIADFGYRAIHETAVAAKALIAAHYGQGPKRSYFNSCSNGGRQALMEAQRFPEDYDGIVAGAPANYWTRLLTSAAWGVKALLSEPASYISQAKLPAIQAAVRAACDANDGVKDGVLENPATCRFDPAVLQCKGAESDSCLTAPQLAALKKVQSGPLTGKGSTLFPAVSPGGEAEAGGWGPWITGPEREKSSMYNFGTQFFKNMVYNNPDWDFRTFDVDRDYKAARRLAKTLDATNPDLSKFQARGGKLILYHGWSDAAIPGQNTIDYFQSVEKKLGADRTRQFVRLFMAPGVQHCAGGSGANVFGQAAPAQKDADHDVGAALERWVEQGVAPERIIATRYKDQGQREVEKTRPLCAFPLVAKYKGSGEVNDAANFTCGQP